MVYNYASNLDNSVANATTTITIRNINQTDTKINGLESSNKNLKFDKNLTRRHENSKKVTKKGK